MRNSFNNYEVRIISHLKVKRVFVTLNSIAINCKMSWFTCNRSINRLKGIVISDVRLLSTRTERNRVKYRFNPELMDLIRKDNNDKEKEMQEKQEKECESIIDLYFSRAKCSATVCGGMRFMYSKTKERKNVL